MSGWLLAVLITTLCVGVHFAACSTEIRFVKHEPQTPSPQAGPAPLRSEAASPDTSRDNQPLVSGDASNNFPH